jgi:AraC family transcriptional regulator of adaptative response / DNA-3-methyladenine glycosylase II
MPLDADQCRAAHVSRDPRFDGRFVLGVRTTGIFCRPVCPAPTARAENVEYFETVEGARAAGYRPCRRCRPATALARPTSHGTAATALRAARLVADGALDHAPVAVLAGRLGLGERQLRRLLEAHLGVSPVQLAQQHRLVVARTLLQQGATPLVEVAALSGFRSVSRFNAAFRTAYGAAPGTFRVASPASAPPADYTIVLEGASPLDGDAMRAFYGQRAVPGVGAIEGSTCTVAFPMPLGPVRAALTPTVRGLHARFSLAGPAALAPAVARLRRALDLDTRLDEIAAALGVDPVLSRALAVTGPPRLFGHFDPFETLARAIIGQQVSVAAARTLAGRVAARWGTPLEPQQVVSGVERTFPRPDALADAPLETVGLPRARAAALRTLAAAVCATPALLEPPSDVDAWATALVELPGIGPWTAHYAALRAFAEPDAFPAGDLVVRRAHAVLEGLEAPLSTAALTRRAERWRPFRGYAAQLLWNYAATRSPA